MRRLALLLIPVLALACAPGAPGEGPREGGAERAAGGAPPGDENDAAFLALAAQVESRPELATRLASAARERHRQPEAIAALERALEGRPDDPDLLFVAATLEMDLERRGGAELRLRRALELRPGHLPSLVQLSRLLSEAYRWSEALEIVTGGEEEICGPVRRGEATDARGRRRAATLLVQKGRLLLALDRGAEAVATSREAAALDPGYGETSYGLGLALIAAGRLEEARAALAVARRSDPDHLEAAYQAMNVAERLGRMEEAREARVRFEELYRRHLISGAGRPGGEGRP